uniref:PCI domain-containing protein n=1 Tax=Cuerna arida TaxID=1464854 RepID=A0A1B6GA47_9HEMI
MSVMGDKGQPPQQWQYPMYGGYNPYQQYPSYEPQHFFNYYHGAMPYGHMNGQPPNMMHAGLKQFTPGGQLQAFNQEKAIEEKELEGDDGNDLPPLPPGPPPSSLPQPSPPGSTSFFQQNNQGVGPIRFNMNRQQRPPFPTQAVFNNSGSSKKKRKKKNKFNQQNQGQNQNQMAFVPPLPQPLPPQAIKAPPLPPGPPPVSPKPMPEEGKPLLLPEPKPKPQANTFETGGQQDWPKELQNYITSCYAKCQNAVDKDRVGIILKGKIIRATNDNTLWIKDWSKEPLPLLESEMATATVLPVFKPEPKKRLSTALTSRLGLRLRSRSRSRSSSRSRSRSPQKQRQRSPPRARRRRDRGGSSGSENDWTPPPTAKKGKGRNLDHSFSKRGGKGKNKGKEKGHFYSEFGEGDVPVNSELLEKRAARFSGGRSGRSVRPPTTPTANMTISVFEDTSGDFDLEECHIVGVCQDIEKPYLRLTAAPEACAVRPPDVLRQSLLRVKERWLQNQDYHYACEQLKSIRQDLTVQGIRDKLTVSVYETHARIALEKGDHAEFNQCQSQLKLLYEELPTDNKQEFTAYRILYYIFTKENMDLNTVMTALTEEDREDECISHALQVRSAWALGNYHRLFLLYREAPRMSSYLMDWFLLRERKLALKSIVKAYRQTLPVSFLTQELAFQTDLACHQFLSQFGVVYADGERTKIDCKMSATSVSSA